MTGTIDKPIRIGCVDGRPRRLNERMIDSRWRAYLGEYTEVVNIAPFRFFKLFGGTVDRWVRDFPLSLEPFAEGLADLCERYRIRMIYMNLPAFIPYVLMARNYAGLDLGVLFLAHSVGSEYWLRQWIAIAPWLTKRDVLLSSTDSSRKALLQISDRYQLSRHIPLGIEMRADGKADPPAEKTGKRLLSIGRVEDVKNIHLLLECFAEMRRHADGLRLTIAGEYTGGSQAQIDRYAQRIERLVRKWELEDSVLFAGSVEGAAKDELFRTSDLLVNLSTDPGETFGFNLIEAKTWGLPVVCANWDGFREVVTHGKDGFLVDCHWPDERPSLQLDQAVRYCLRLLEDRPLHRSFSAQAEASARLYDYRRIFPSIAEAVRGASARAVAASPEAASMAMSPLSEFKDIYRLTNLSRLSFYGQPLISIVSGQSVQPLDSWMAQVKPMIHHFAGRCQYAKL